MTCPPTPSLRPFLAAALVLPFLLLAGCGDGASEGSGGDAAPAAEALPAEPLGTSTIAGVVRFDGEVPELRPLNMDADPACAAKHTEPVYPELLAVDEQAGLANVLVYVADNVPEGPYPPAAPPVIDQQGCRYTPRVAGIMVGQELKVLNSDELLHNVHSLSEVNRPFNRAMPAAIKQATFSFTDEEAAFRIKCDVHPWMSSYLAVFNHPYFAVTGPDGSFEIPGLPAGTYTIEAWHERLGTMRSGVTLLDGLAATLDLTFTLPE
ncbi:MAG: carboxypeptidase regulatory-like domain-containing protein [Acidobacteria bacterium]|nr:carboxypeptidase regulatory-like domain-containing protein [Acidobacteriota bacterium]